MRQSFRVEISPCYVQMRFRIKATLYQRARGNRSGVFVAFVLCCLIVVGGGCVLVGNDVETYYGRVKVHDAKDFRWSNGGLPQQFDPALVAAAPDTDAVRALCEGLTNYDSRSLAVLPGAAQRWESSDDYRVWTFYLRANGRWSNDDPVTAQDFVRSWRRAAAFGDQAPHRTLLENIVGLHSTHIASVSARRSAVDGKQGDTSNAANEQTPVAGAVETRKLNSKQRSVELSSGVEAVNRNVLRVRLLRPDANFPALVAHPVFYPVHDETNVAAESQTIESQTAGKRISPPTLVTNGAFHLASLSTDNVVLERAPNYWDAAEVKLQRVRFVANTNAESALSAYRAGEVDAVTNAGLEPLALKLLAPYKDFRRATYGALTFYKINTAKPPFGDVRVRQALALAIDRERLCEDEMNGATEPANKFLPAQLSSETKTNADSPALLEYDTPRARRLFADAGFPQGKGFPTLRLLINRNDQQRLVAQAVAGMWQRALGITTEIIVKDWDAYEAALLAGDYDVARRGIVMQTPDEADNLRSMFEPETAASNAAQKNNSDASPKNKDTFAPAAIDVTTEREALRQMPAIPLYFASSYALVKPYVNGFDANLLDAPSLKRVRIDADWRMPQKSDASLVTRDN